MGWIASRIFHRFDNSCSQLPNSRQFPVREDDRSFGRHTGGDSQKRTLLHDRDVLLGGDHLQISKSASSVPPRRAIREEQEQHGSIIQHAAPLLSRFVLLAGIIAYLDGCCCRMAVILYPGVMAGRFQHFSRVGEILDSRFDWGVAPHTTRKGLGLLGHVWIFSVCCKVGSTRASERLHLIRTSALPKGTNPSKRDEKKLQRRIDWPPSTAAPTALSLAWPPHQTRSFFTSCFSRRPHTLFPTSFAKNHHKPQTCRHRASSASARRRRPPPSPTARFVPPPITGCIGVSSRSKSALTRSRSLEVFSVHNNYGRFRLERGGPYIVVLRCCGNF